MLDQNGNHVITWDANSLANLDAAAIDNQYVAKVKPGPHSLIIPLGAKAMVTLADTRLASLGNPHRLRILSLLCHGQKTVEQLEGLIGQSKANTIAPFRGCMKRFSVWMQKIHC